MNNIKMKVLNLLLLLLSSCHGKKSTSQILCTIDSLSFTKWERLEITNGDTIIFRPFDADNTIIEFKENEITINYGQEEVTYAIKERGVVGNEVY